MCWLCGVKVPHSKALLGHSDADVGMHALTDAIYGALADGRYRPPFPALGPAMEGRCQPHLSCAHAVQMAAGARLCHLERRCDAGLRTAEDRPACPGDAGRTGPDIMGLDPARISVKATTSERLGFTGREEGIAAIATALLVKS